MRRAAALALCLCLLGCLPAAEASNVEDSLVVGIQSTKTTAIRPLDPQERDMMSIYDLLYDSLVTIDDNYLPQPGLAESWEESGSGKTWTFHLRENVTFSDGTPLTANDVVATAQYILRRAQDETSADKGYYANLNYFVSSISAKDDTTVVVKAARKYWGLLYAMTFPVLPAAYVESDNPPGTGAYVVSTFEPANYLWLQANTNWWQTQPQVKEIMVVCHNTPGDVIESYEYARVDACFTRSISAAQYKSGTTSLALDYRTNQLEVLLMNHSAAPLNSINVRKAIRYAIDVDKIASTVYMGMVERTDTPAIPGTWMYNDTLDSYFVTDLDAARALLAEDGWEDSNEDGYLDKVNDKGELQTLSLTLRVYEEPDNNVRLEVAESIATSLAAIGIDCTTSTVTFANMQSRLSAGSYELALAAYAMDPCPDWGFMLMSGNTGNYTRYRSNDMTDLCKELRTKTDQGSYTDTLYKIQTKFAEDCPFICLYYRAGSVLTRRMYTTVRDVREYELLRGIDTFHEN